MRSVFTSLVTEVLPIPQDPGQSVTIRKLAPRHLALAAEASQAKYVGLVKGMGGPGFVKELQDLHVVPVVPETAEETAPVVDPLMTFDRIVLMEKGVTSWTYDRPIRNKTGVIRDEDGLSVFADLDEETADFIAGAILKLSKPALSATKDEQEADRKNG